MRAETPAPLPAPPIIPEPLPSPPAVNRATSASGSGAVPMSVTGSGGMRAPTNGDGLHPLAPSDWLADRVADVHAQQGARRDPSAVEDDVLVAAPLRVGGGLNKRLIAIVGGAVLLLVIILFAATRGGKSSKQDARASKPAGSATQVAVAGEPSPTNPTTDDSTPTTAPTKQPAHHGGTAAITTPGTGSADTATNPVETVTPPTTTPTTTEPTPAPPPTPKKHPTLGGKKVVLEYDTPTHEAPKPTTTPEEDSPAIGRARVSYAAGNKLLFAGDPDGAVKAYQQALAAYPGYVAGYRGLGLAYSQTGDKLKAMSAFHQYLNAVPAAKDAALIKKRLAALSH